MGKYLIHLAPTHSAVRPAVALAVSRSGRRLLAWSQVDRGEGLTPSPDPRALPENEPTPEPGAGPMPEYLSPEAAAHWPEIAAQLEDAGVLTVSEVAACPRRCWIR
jgi:hypothetical protein